MEFNKKVIDKLMPIFNRHKFHIIDEVSNYFELKSDKVTITISYDIRENVGVLSAGSDELVVFDDVILNRFFDIDVDKYFIVPERNQDDFINNLITFFEGKGKALLEGDTKTLKAIEKFDQKRADAYTQQILNDQDFKEADNAWETKNYTSFLKVLNRIGLNKMPKTYLAKYKYALKSLGN